MFVLIKRLFSVWMPALTAMLYLINGCATTPADVMHKDALHISQFPAGAAMPIDGIWKDPWGDKACIEKGRMFLIDFVYPMVVIADIQRIAPGKYKGVGTGSKMILGEDFTLTIVAEDKILLKTETTDRVYYRIKLNDPAGYRYELDVLRGAGKQHQKTTVPLKIHRLTTAPQWVKPGAKFDLITEFTALSHTDTQQVPVTMQYQILVQDRVLYQSKPTHVQAASGERMAKTIHLKAAKKTGRYQLRVELASAQTKAEQTVCFDISTQPAVATDTQATAGPDLLEDRDALLDALTGDWEFVIPGFPPHSMRIQRQGERLTAQLKFLKQWQVDECTLWLEKKTLKIRSRLSSPSLECWVVAEDTVTLNSQLQDMPFRSKVLEGNSVRIGEVFKGTMRRALLEKTGAQTVKLCPVTLYEYSRQPGKILYFKVKGRKYGSVYGTDIYTIDSDPAAAVVHAGLLKPGQTGVIKFTILPGQQKYQASMRNNIRSQGYGQWHTSYAVALADDSPTTKQSPPKTVDAVKNRRKGDHVLVNWSHDSYWYPATIKKIDGSRYYILFDDGDKEWTTAERITTEEIKVGSKVFANWKKKGHYYPGRVTQRNGDRIHIQYDDGDKETTTISVVRVLR